MGVRRKLVTYTYLLKYFTNVNVPFEKLSPVNTVKFWGTNSKCHVSVHRDVVSEKY